VTTTKTPADNLLHRCMTTANYHDDAIGAFRTLLAEKAVATDTTPADLASICNDLARHEAARSTYLRAGQMLVNGRTVADVKEMLFDTVAAGADDQWSGRGNDVKRAAHDGRCDAVSRLRLIIESP
jgi:hypothetical protein